MVLYGSFSGTCCMLCNMFLKKKRIFRPAGGESGRSSRQSPGLDTHRVTRVINTTYAVDDQTKHCTSCKPASPAAAWYFMDLFHQKIHVVNFLVKKIGNFPPCRRRYPPPNVGSPDTWQHWPFRGFRSCRVVRGPNSHRVTRVMKVRAQQWPGRYPAGIICEATAAPLHSTPE